MTLHMDHARQGYDVPLPTTCLNEKIDRSTMNVVGQQIPTLKHLARTARSERRYSNPGLCEAHDPSKTRQLKIKARLLKQQQDQLAQQFQELSAEAEQLTEQEKREVQGELSATSDQVCSSSLRSM